jgi:hypothetical protein
MGYGLRLCVFCAMRSTRASVGIVVPTFTDKSCMAYEFSETLLSFSTKGYSIVMNMIIARQRFGKHVTATTNSCRIIDCWATGW